MCICQHPFYKALTEDDVTDPEVTKAVNIENHLYRCVNGFFILVNNTLMTLYRTGVTLVIFYARIIAIMKKNEHSLT